MSSNKKKKKRNNKKKNNNKVIIEKDNKKVENNVKKELWKNNFLCNAFINFLILLFIEIIFRILSDFNIISYATLRIAIGCIISSLIITFLSHITKRNWLKNTISIIFILFYSIYSWLQLGFMNFLGVYISLNTSSQFGAVKDYVKEFLSSFKINYYLIFIPIIIYIIYLIIIRKKEYNKFNFKIKYVLLILGCLLLSTVIYISTLYLSFMQNELQSKSNKELFINPDVPTIVVHEFGPVTFGLLDLKVYLFPINEEVVFSNSESVAKENITKREVSDILDNIEENKKIYNTLNKYFASQKVTDYNDYTGLFEGKNVIVILMESVNEAIIDEEKYPNFYKMYSEGFHWVNNYSPRNSCATGNNEFSAMTSLYSIYNTCTSNDYRKNTYFEAIFNLFNNKGYETSSMHDFVEWYYYRKTIHPNMGSQNYYDATKLKIKTAGYYGEWPSDEEFFDKAMDILLNRDSDKPFMTFLTTVTTHTPYSVSSTYGDLYKDEYKSEGYSTEASRYLSKLKVLDNGLGIMLEKLEESKKLDDTVIVLLADHYPYGLSKKQVAEIIDHDLTDYEIERTPFVIYNSKIKPQSFDSYTSYINLLPTLANLMDLDFDPRLYMGRDLLSKDYKSMVVFADGSWKNEYAYYNAQKSKIKYYQDVTYTNEEIQEINNEIRLKIEMSSSAIKNNYFKYLNDKINEINTEKEKE